MEPPNRPAGAPAVDLLAIETFRDGHPWETLAWLREHDPVHWHSEPAGRSGFWALTRYEDIRWVNASPDFSHGPSAFIEADIPLGMLNLDPPEHTAMRKGLAKFFMPNAIPALERRYAQAAADIITEIRPGGGAEMCFDVAGRMAAYATADLLCLPREEAVLLYDYVEIIVGGGAHTPEEQTQANQAVFDYAMAVWRDRTKNPRDDDLPSELANGSFDGAQLSPEVFCANYVLLHIGAGDTTRHLIAGGLLALLEHPEQRAFLDADLDVRLPAAIEEMLRWVTPVGYNRRTALRDLDLRGTQIAAGDKVVVYNSAGNRDPLAFAEPDRFEVARSPNRHLSFGGVGAHFCIGAHIARSVTFAMMKALLTDLPEIRVSGAVEFERSNMAMGPLRMPVEF